MSWNYVRPKENFLLKGEPNLAFLLIPEKFGRFFFQSYDDNSLYFHASQLKPLVEAMPGQSPVPFRSFSRVKQAIPVRSLYKLLFGSQAGQTSALLHKCLFGSWARQTGTLPPEYSARIMPTTLVYSHFNPNSCWKLSRANRYTSMWDLLLES